MPLFNIIFNGQIAAHATLEQAKQSLAQLYQVDTARIDGLFNGHTHVLKANLSSEQADQYLALLQQTGIMVQKQVIASELALELVPSPTDPLIRNQAPQPQAAPNPHRYASEPPTLTPNPYATPKTISHDAESGEYGELKYFTADGRIGRMRLLAWNLGLGFIVALAFLGVGLFVGISSLISPNASQVLAIALGSMIYIAMIVLLILFNIKRLHDINRSGWLYLLILVPIVNIFFGIYLLCAAGSPSDNDYGAPPPPNTTGVKVLFWMFIAIMILGIVASIALPTLLMNH